MSCPYPRKLLYVPPLEASRGIDSSVRRGSFCGQQDISNLIAATLRCAGWRPAKHGCRPKIRTISVNVDLPHLPAKTVGPDELMPKANSDAAIMDRRGHPETRWAAGDLSYAQTYEHRGHKYNRRGVITLVKLSPFGEGHVIPHEKTYKGRSKTAEADARDGDAALADLRAVQRSEK